MEYKIIVDSCCDLSPELKSRLDAISIPLTMRLGEDEFTDDDNLDLHNFMAQMKACNQKIGSAAPNPYSYQEAMEQAQRSFVVTLSSELSGSYGSALLGQSLIEEQKIIDTHVFDSKSASAGEVLVAIKIRELIEKGFSKEHIIETINRFIETMKTYFILERYDNLQKNGRLSKIKGTLIGALNMRLVMGSDGNGNIKLYDKFCGRKRTLEKLLSVIENSGKNTDGEHLVISHCNNPELATLLAEEIARRYRFKEIVIIPTGGLSSLYADDKGIIMAF